MQSRGATSILILLATVASATGGGRPAAHRDSPAPVAITLETVTSAAATGDGGNHWGGHQTRIVRTKDGVFTAYTVQAGDGVHREWRLARRQSDGSWPVVASGQAGREPVNLLAGPDGTLYVVGWPEGHATMWSGQPVRRSITMTASPIPGLVEGNWPYGAAGIDGNGRLCVLSSRGGQAPGGSFAWACRDAGTGAWITRTTDLDYRFCYAYLFPDPSGSLSVVATRDVRWEALGYTQPQGVIAYVFNAFGYWRADDLRADSLQRRYQREEPPNAAFPWVFLDAQQDAYLDRAGRMHIIYWLQGPSTGGKRTSRHLVLSPAGAVLQDVPLPAELGQGFSRIFQDARGRFYILGSPGLLFPAGGDGLTLGPPHTLDLQGNPVEYSGFSLSAPRTGTQASDTLDIVFPSDSGKKWIYFRLVASSP